MGRLVGGTSNEDYDFCSQYIFAWYPHWPTSMCTIDNGCSRYFQQRREEFIPVHQDHPYPNLHVQKHYWISLSLNLFPSFKRPIVEGRRDLLIELLSSRLPGDRTSEFKLWSFDWLNHGNLRVRPRCHVYPPGNSRPYSGLIKGQWWLIIH